MSGFWQYAKSTDNGVSWSVKSPFGSAATSFTGGLQGAFAYGYDVKPGLEALGGTDRNGVCQLGLSSDGGNTWSISNPLGGSGYPLSCKFNANGDLGIAGTGSSTSPPKQVGISTNDGSTWTLTSPIYDATHSFTGYFTSVAQDIAFGSDFVVVVGYAQTSHSGGTVTHWHVVVSVSTDNGSTWTSHVDTPFGFTVAQRSNPQIIVLSDDTIILIGIRDDTPHNDMAISNDQGSTWNNVQLAPGFHIAANASDHLICNGALSTDKGVTWTSPINPFPPGDLPGGGSDGIGEVDIANDGTLMISASNTDRVAVSSDSGSTWNIHTITSNYPHVQLTAGCRFGSYVVIGSGWGDPPPPPVPATSAHVQPVDIQGQATLSTTREVFTIGDPPPDPPTFREYWQSQPNPTPFAVEALYFDLNNVVIDEVYVDPITFGPSMHFYYSDDDTDDWDLKLWTPIPREYNCQKGFHALPLPTRVKFFKIEFSNLTAAPYQSVEYPEMAPVYYRKFPSWVQDYFTNVYVDKPIEPARKDVVTNVVIDPLSFGFQTVDDRMVTNYEAERTAQVKGTTTEVQDFITNTLEGNQPSIQSTVEDQIRFKSPIMWQADLIAQLDPTRFLSRVALQPREDLLDTGWSAELGIPLFATPTQATTTNQDQAFIEKHTPIMWFPRRARHQYQKVLAQFDKKIAYFVAIRAIKFFRRDFSAEVDDAVYYETLEDSAHIDTNDFVQDDWRFVITP